MRALVVVLDSVGIGGAPDAEEYRDTGANTLGHLLDFDSRLKLPNLWCLGLGHILDREPSATLSASYGQMREVSAGKDSTTGHWELAGVILDQPFSVFEKFPPELVEPIEREAGVRFIGNFPASGTEIIQRLGEEHLRTGRLILYTSADSVLQIAAHEQVIPVDRLYEICKIARRHADPYRIGRVIARPFIGEPGNFTRTSRRHDFSMRPPRTVLNAIQDAGFPVKAVGKIVDLFAGEGITESYPTASNADGMSRIESVWRETDRGLVFANLVDFDMIFGHRRDPRGYADALIEFDAWLGDFLSHCHDEDLLIITADHGNDPTFRGTDHTREQVPLMVRYQGQTGDLGTRQTFADVAATLSAFFRLEPWPVGTSLIARQISRSDSHDHVPADPARRPLAGRADDRRAHAWRSPEPPGPPAGPEPGRPAGEGADPRRVLQSD